MQSALEDISVEDLVYNDDDDFTSRLSKKRKKFHDPKDIASNSRLSLAAFLENNDSDFPLRIAPPRTIPKASFTVSSSDVLKDPLAYAHVPKPTDDRPEDDDLEITEFNQPTQSAEKRVDKPPSHERLPDFPEDVRNDFPDMSIRERTSPLFRKGIPSPLPEIPAPPTPATIPVRSFTEDVPNIRRENLTNTFNEIERIQVFRRQPKSDHISVDSDGQKLYLRFKKKNWQKLEHASFADANVRHTSSQASFHAFRILLDDVRNQMDVDRQIPKDYTPTLPVNTAFEARDVWVEKYRPNRYLELLSDEGVNRALLHWLKLWDPVVFNREPSFMNPYNNFGKRKKKDDKPQFDRRKYGGVSDIFFTVDADKRPKFKAALLCGPPGLGKTTLAQVIARHAGYEPMEMNASDDRTIEIFRNRVESSVMNGNVVSMLQDGKVNRPKCLIIDEIDGAPANTVEYLVKLLKGEARTNPAKKKTKTKLGLWRPIICICNDMYVPALKSLRQSTMVLRFPSIDRSRLVSRLSDICRGMEVQADSSVLTTLCEKSEDDIRTCLNSLQFASVQGKRLNIQEISKATMGCKDNRKQLLKVWETIFRLPRPKPTEFSSTSATDRIGHILQTVQLGETDKIMSGVFENFLIVHHKDSSLHTASECANWRAYTDVMERGIYEDQNWSLLSYLPFYAVAVHLHLGALSTPLFSFPTTHFEAYKRTSQNKETIAALLKDLAPSLYSSVKRQLPETELLPFLVHIIQPPLKSTSLHLSNHERSELKRVVDLMVTYGLTYREERTVTSFHRELLDPQLESIASFPNVQQCPAMQTAVRAMVSREVQLQLINVNARKEDSSTEELADIVQEPVTKPVVKPNEPPGGKNTSKLQVWSVYDYFRGQNPSQTPKPAAADQRTKIWFRYKEGYSNAVCRDIKVKDLM
ncbi:hypothetical protein RvY_15770 [Ramazzottius varieornatus]|uniref:AAA+ ATPase domain-containing protein n=1 Tax=Ramazzottius varieornatus TaxID=947166 RepID=A0A1D1VXK8_RAMVA|nr:hypothetical protein RvY_15770 [Ramazzottius varieornatus]